jgi:hypothetical protein
VSDPLGVAHESHDLELVARAAAGDLAAGEGMAARERLATCETCAELATDLGAIATATRDLGSAALRAASITAPRDFRLTAADAARLRRRRLLGTGGGLALIGGRARGFGGALATLGLVGLLVSAGLPALLGSAGSASSSSEELGSGIGKDIASPIAAMNPQASDRTHQLAASGDPARTGDGGLELTASPPTAVAFLAVLAVASIVVLVAGLALLLIGRPRHRAGP